jgi:hypothetical protein
MQILIDVVEILQPFTNNTNNDISKVSNFRQNTIVCEF